MLATFQWFCILQGTLAKKVSQTYYKAQAQSLPMLSWQVQRETAKVGSDNTLRRAEVVGCFK